MTDVTRESILQKTAISLLRYYSFDTADKSLSLVVINWLSHYPPQWILDAIIEALYQGRYKTISVEQILLIWERRGKPISHFNHEFQRIVCDRILDEINDQYQTSQPTVAPPALTDQNPTLFSEAADQGKLNRLGYLGDQDNDQGLMPDASDHSQLQQRPQEITPIMVAPATSADVPPVSVPSASKPSSSTSTVIASEKKTSRVSQPQHTPVNVDPSGEPAPNYRHYPIDQFQPANSSLRIHNKLRSIAQHRLSSSSQEYNTHGGHRPS